MSFRKSTIAAIVGLAALGFGSSAWAGHGSPEQYQQDLQRREWNRERQFNESARRPMNWQQQQELESRLSREALRDQQEYSRYMSDYQRNHSPVVPYGAYGSGGYYGNGWGDGARFAPVYPAPSYPGGYRQF